MNILNVAIIGSNGFIARHLIKVLRASRGVNLFLFGRSAVSAFGDEFPYKAIDFYNEESIQIDFSKIDVIYHMVSETIPSTSWEDPLIEIEKNLIPFTKFLNTVAKLKVKKIVFVSSAGTIYGATSGKVTESSDKRPFSPYGIMKLTMENLLEYYKVKYNVQYDVYRVSNVYGEGQDTSKGLGIINTFLEKIIRDKQVGIFGDGESTRNYIYARDVAELLCYSVKNTTVSGIYNLSSNSTFTINQLIKLLKNIVEEKFDVHYEKGRQSDNSYIDLDNTSILALHTDFKFTEITEGIKKTYLELKSEKIKS